MVFLSPHWEMVLVERLIENYCSDIIPAFVNFQWIYVFNTFAGGHCRQEGYEVAKVY